MSGSVSGAPNLSVINAITQFVNGTQAVWNAITTPIPVGLVVYATDTTAVKMGDGTSLYSALPTLFTINSIIGLTNTLATLSSTVSGNSSSIATTATNVATNTAAISTLTTEYTTLNTAVTALQAPNVFSISTSGNVTIVAGNMFYGIKNTVAAPIVVTLPATGASGEEHMIKDLAGNVSSTNTITLTAGGTTMIDGGTTYIMNTSYSHLRVKWNGTSWSVI